jgi:hypothetical protein
LNIEEQENQLEAFTDGASHLEVIAARGETNMFRSRVSVIWKRSISKTIRHEQRSSD